MITAIATSQLESVAIVRVSDIQGTVPNLIMNQQHGERSEAFLASLPQKRDRCLEAVGPEALYRAVQLLHEGFDLEPATAGQRGRGD